MNKISLMIIFCCVSMAVFGQSLSVKKQPSGNGPILNMHITEAKATGNLNGLCDFDGAKSVPCSDRGDVHIHTSGNTITQYRYNGKTYPVDDGEMACYSCDQVKITGVIKAGGETFTVSKETGPMATGSYHLPFDIGTSVPSNSISLVSLTIEPVSHPDFESKLDNQAARKEQKKKDEQGKAKPEAEQKGQEEGTAEQEENEITTDSNTWSTDEDEDNTAAGNQAQRTLSPEEYRRKLLEETARKEAEINRKAETARSAVEATGSMVTAMIDEESNYELTLDVGIPDDLSILYYNLTFGKRSQNKLYTGFDFSLGYAEYSFYEEKDGNTERMDETAYGLSFGVPVGYRIPLTSGISTTEGSLLIGVNASASMYMGDVKMPMTFYVGPFVGIYIMHINFQFGYGSYYDLFGDSIANNALKGKQNGGNSAGFHMKVGFAW